MNAKQAASIILNRKRRNTYPVWLTAQQAASLLDVHVNTIYELCKQGKLPHLNLGTALRIDRDGLFLLARKERPPDNTTLPAQYRANKPPVATDYGTKGGRG